MNRRSILLALLLSILPLMGYSWGLTYRVLNGTSAVVKFNSTDWFDWGTRIYSGEMKYNTYYFPAKNMYLTLYNYDGSRFTLTTSSGCDLVGLPPLRLPSAPVYQVKGNTVRMSSGIIDIVIKEQPGSTYYNRSISCSIVRS